MFRGINTVSVDAKNRLTLPSKIREILRDNQINDLVMTLNPWDRNTGLRISHHSCKLPMSENYPWNPRSQILVQAGQLLGLQYRPW